MADEKKPPTPPGDVIAVGPMLPTGDITFVRQRQDDDGTGTIVEGGTLRVLPNGPPDEPSDGAEVLKVSHLQDNLYKVDEVVHKGGPAMVNSTAFRNGWETIFGGRQTVGQA